MKDLIFKTRPNDQYILGAISQWDVQVEALFVGTWWKPYYGYLYKKKSVLIN